MKAEQYYLAQLNIALMRAPLNDPLMADFVAQLDAINAIADNSPGFVWRLQDQAGNATGIHAYDDERMLVNLTVWQSIAALSAYVYRSQHGEVMRDRRRWFEKSDQLTFVLWWIPAGHLPGLEEAKERLEHLRRHGATAYAFSFKTPFPSPNAIHLEELNHAISE
jgi:hypothetical protein